MRHHWARIVGQTFVGPIDRIEFPFRCAGFGHDVQRRNTLDRRIGLVDDDRPRAVRMPVGRNPGRAVNGTHLRSRICCHCGRVEGRVLDGVAHSEDVLVAHRLHVQQRAAVVEVELAVPAIMDGVTEIHELGRRTDVELQALEDRRHVIALVVQRPLHALGVDRAGAGPFLDGNLHHLVTAKLLDAPGHAGAVDHVSDQQELGHQNRQLLAGQLGVARLTHRPKIDSTML
jgi:hypothetical protein